MSGDTQHPQNQQPLSVPTLANKIANLSVNDYPSFIKALEFSDKTSSAVREVGRMGVYPSISTDGDKMRHGHFFFGLSSNVAYDKCEFRAQI